MDKLLFIEEVVYDNFCRAVAANDREKAEIAFGSLWDIDKALAEKSTCGESTAADEKRLDARLKRYRSILA